MLFSHLVKHQFQPQERAAAKAAGETTYFTGRPCKYGHVADRCTASGGCVICCNERHKKRSAADPEKYRRYARNSYAKNAESRREFAREYRKKNPEKVRDAVKRWTQANPHKRSLIQQKQAASKMQRTPSWLTEKDWSDIEAYYIAAKQTEKAFGVKIDVDHIVPLQGKNVSGLHVPWNLRLTTATDNRRKNNKFIEFPWRHSGKGVMVGESALPWNLRKEV